MSKDQDNISFVLQEPNKVNFESRPVPEPKASDDVIVAIKWTGICGSDVHYWTHGRIGNFVVEKPMVLGHESSGIIHAVGKGVKHLAIGDRVALEPGQPCRRCGRCKSGRYNLCVDMVFAATPPYDGTLARYYRIPEDFCYKLPEDIPLEHGALVEPLGVAVHMVRTQANVTHGDSVIVFGAGPVGLLCCAVARALGARTIVAVDINAERLEFAKSYAATQTWQAPLSGSSTDNAAALLADCGLPVDGVKVAIDASGAESCIRMGIHVLHPGGTYVQGGMGKPEISFPITEMCTKELSVKGSFRYGPSDYELAIELLAQRRVEVGALISGRVDFLDAERAFEDVKAAKGIKVLIRGPE